MPSNQNKNENAHRRSPLTALKFLELLLTCVCTWCHYYSFTERDLDTEFLATGTFCGFIIILIAIMAGYLTKAPLNKRIFLLYSILGTFLFLTSGVLILQSWRRSFRTDTRDLAMLKGVVSIINGAIFFMDTIFTFLQTK